MYEKYIKRLIDFILSLMGIIILSPLFLVLIILGLAFMHGNPFLLRIDQEKMKKYLNL